MMKSLNFNVKELKIKVEFLKIIVIPIKKKSKFDNYSFCFHDCSWQTDKTLILIDFQFLVVQFDTFLAEILMVKDAYY